MENKRLELDIFLNHIKENFGEAVIFDAVEELTNQEIVFEDQFPFLNDATMRKRNFEVQMSLFERYGYEGPGETHVRMVDVPGRGWMNCFYRLGGRFSTMEDVKSEVLRHFTNQV